MLAFLFFFIFYFFYKESLSWVWAVYGIYVVIRLSNTNSLSFSFSSPYYCYGRIAWWNLSIASVWGILAISAKKNYLRLTHICVKLYPLVFKVTFPLIQSWKRCSWGFSKAKRTANVQSSHSMVEMSPVEYQVSCNLLVHCVGPTHWAVGQCREAHLLQQEYPEHKSAKS